MRCPVCKAENSQGPACRRCKADLSLLWQLETAREAAIATAQRNLVNGSGQEAEVAARRANELRRDADSLRLLACARVLNRDFAGALQAYQAIRPAERAAL